ncbi:hypothetical protein [Mesorhizobium sp.]|uniref:hypothetical protein n=1 Tax=Mesorhizobium sp. TaxID=1871066 RepID=UPI001209EE99|nr:hypothetical protein [Mesorhizobium sp.]TIL38531.1 MAG: hypothetical protein E5Y82_13595 [Mesorhizobium sp.]
MKHVTLRPFGWYPDGYTREALDIGAERDFGDATDGLLAAKMIGGIKPVQTALSAEALIAPIEAQSTPVATHAAEELDLTDSLAGKPRRGRHKKV